jgi:DnaJ-class molecular chaperone
MYDDERAPEICEECGGAKTTLDGAPCPSCRGSGQINRVMVRRDMISTRVPRSIHLALMREAHRRRISMNRLAVDLWREGLRETMSATEK